MLRELDALKTIHDRARECIRWLDKTISNGSPFLKTQELREKLPIRDYVKPRMQGKRKLEKSVPTPICVTLMAYFVQVLQRLVS